MAMSIKVAAGRHAFGTQPFSYHHVITIIVPDETPKSEVSSSPRNPSQQSIAAGRSWLEYWQSKEGKLRLFELVAISIIVFVLVRIYVRNQSNSWNGFSKWMETYETVQRELLLRQLKKQQDAATAAALKTLQDQAVGIGREGL